MNHTSLEIFSIVAEELSINKAAKRLGRVQSNITTRIQHLEDELDVRLFIRENRRLKLSAQGHKFLVYAKKILSLAEEARQALHPLMPSGKLALGSMESTAASRLTIPLAIFTKTCPEVELTFVTQPTQQLIEKVQSLALDSALVALPLNQEGNVDCPADLSYQPLFVEKLVLLLPVGINTIKNKTQIESKKFAAFAQGCTYREIALSMLKKVDEQGTLLQIQEVNSYHAMLTCVASGNYFCLLPESVLSLMLLPEGISILAAGQATTHLIWRTDSQSPALDSLQRILLSTSNMATR